MKRRTVRCLSEGPLNLVYTCGVVVNINEYNKSEYK